MPSPEQELGDAIRVVTAGGAGVGRFLAAALIEALQVGGEVGVCISAAPPVGGVAGIDFVFRHPGAAEVIRVGLDAENRVVSAELFRGRPTGPVVSAHPLRSAGLLEALDAGESVAELKWHKSPWSSDGIEILMRRDCRVSVALSG